MVDKVRSLLVLTKVRHTSVLSVDCCWVERRLRGGAAAVTISDGSLSAKDSQVRDSINACRMRRGQSKAHGFCRCRVPTATCQDGQLLLPEEPMLAHSLQWLHVIWILKKQAYVKGLRLWGTIRALMLWMQAVMYCTVQQRTVPYSETSC